MQSISIADKRHFSLQDVQIVDLVKTDDLQAQLLCFEAGQKMDTDSNPSDCVYEVREGELLIRIDDEKVRLGKGKLLLVPSGKTHSLENAGGGLLVVMTISRAN